jgi:hypothetical protein
MPTGADYERCCARSGSTLELDAEKWEQTEKDMRAIGGENWAIGIGRLIGPGLDQAEVHHTNIRGILRLYG